MAQATAETALERIDIYDSELLDCPYAFFRKLTEEAPVLKHEESGIYQVSRFDLVKKVLLDTKNFSNEIGHALHDRSMTAQKVAEIMKDAHPTASVLHTADGPTHKFSRQLVNRAFSPVRVNGLRPRIEEVTDELIDRFADRGSVELMSEFSQMLPLTIIAEQMGVETEDLPRFRAWSDAFAARFSHSADEETQIAAAKSVVEFQQYFQQVLEEKKANPSEDVISVIAGALDAGPDVEESLTLPQALQACQQILVGGNESTAATISEGMLMLLQDKPELIPQIRDDPKARLDMIEELLRLHSAVNCMWRMAAETVELDGVTIPKGSLVLLRFGAANRDEAMFADAADMNLDRDNSRRHLAFGFGIHICIGAQLARAEIDIAFDRLLNRLEGWRLADNARPVHNPSVLIRALHDLHLEFEPEKKQA